jgi:hypothetical protein
VRVRYEAATSTSTRERLERVRHTQGHVRGSARHRRAALATCCALVVGGLLLASCTSASSGTLRLPPATKIVPRVLRVSPGIVAGKGGGTVTIVGKGFVQGMAITIGGVDAPTVDVRNPDTAVAVVPPGIGTEIVRAVTAGGKSFSNPRSVLRYTNRVLVVGDSLGIDLGWGFTASLDAQANLVVADDSVGSSGLVRNDFYNWPAHLRADIAATHPDIVVTLFGTNDQQSIETAKGIFEPGTSAWDKAYASRVREITSLVHRAGATLVWVGLPRMGPQSVLDPQLTSEMISLDQSVVAPLHWGTFVNTWPLFTNAKGAYTPYVELSPGVFVLGHQPDGTHLTPDGAIVIDAKAVDALRAMLTKH